MTDKKTLWSGGANAGLALGGVSIAYVLLTLLTGKLAGGSTGMAFLVSVLNFLLWAAKFAGCILLMKLFMKKFASLDPAIDNRDTFNFGVVAALLSAVLFSAFELAYLQFIAPDTIRDAFDTVMAQMSNQLDSNSLQAIDAIEDKLPQITFFSNLIYCFLFGTVLSAILSKNIPSRNPFARQQPQDRPDEQ